MGKKLTIEEVKERIKQIHGDIIVLDESTYVNVNTKCRFIDKDYGEYWTLPFYPLSGCCCKIRNDKKLIKSLSEIKEKLHKVHGDTITIDESTYVSCKKKAKFIDKDYGVWWAIPYNVIRGHKHWKRARILPIEQVRKRIKQIHGDSVNIDESTYIDTRHKCKFFDKDYGEWWTTPNSVLNGHGYIKRKTEKMIKTCQEKFGVLNPMQNKDIALKCAKSQHNSGVIKHWKTGEDCIWMGSYEESVLLDCNKKKIEYLWQSEVFKMPNGKTYRPDMYLIKENKWIEIKRIF
jgi:hypothetical protein